MELLDKWIVETCCYAGCHCTFCMTSGMVDELEKTHHTFYCPNGHPQHYTDMSECEQRNNELSAALDRANASAARLTRKVTLLDYRARYYKGEVTKLKGKQR